MSREKEEEDRRVFGNPKLRNIPEWGLDEDSPLRGHDIIEKHKKIMAAGPPPLSESGSFPGVSAPSGPSPPVLFGVPRASGPAEPPDIPEDVRTAVLEGRMPMPHAPPGGTKGPTPPGKDPKREEKEKFERLKNVYGFTTAKNILDLGLYPQPFDENSPARTKARTIEAIDDAFRSFNSFEYYMNEYKKLIEKERRLLHKYDYEREQHIALNRAFLENYSKTEEARQMRENIPFPVRQILNYIKPIKDPQMVRIPV